MNVIFTCGGTGGHINPAIAVANIVKERDPDSRILFIGAQGHMEEKLVPQAGYELKCLPASGLSRALTLAGLKQNFHAVKCVIRAVSACRKIIREFQPDVILGTGGYASFPALFAGSTMGIPTCVHEANALPGVTTKLVASRADRVLVAFQESVAHYRNPEKIQVVGMPVHRDFVFARRDAARKALGLEGKKVVVSAFGSQGAGKMNEVMADLFAMECADGHPFHHIHATGSYGWKGMQEKVRSKGVDLTSCDEIDMREYIYNMPQLLAAADVFIGRAGSGTCNEIAVAGTPSILIPSPNVTANHQEKNARVLSDNHNAVLLLESDCTPQRLYDEVCALLNDPTRQEAMRAGLRSQAVMDSAERICDILEELIAAK
jgi:UDP-N-acetylglucosamine--N-acetylmuramyl-(pentapeptide) pyrophosphoryl-undecaprenol N-acetylglucosamine transferase